MTTTTWQLAKITSLNKRTGVFEVYCSKYGTYIKGQLTDLINSKINLNDTVRIAVEVLPYALRIKMVTKAGR